MDWQRQKNKVMNLIKNASKLPLFKVALVLCIIVLLWQLAAIRGELRSTKRDVYSLKLSLNDLEFEVTGGYGLDSRVDDLESKVSRIKSTVVNLESDWRWHSH